MGSPEWNKRSKQLAAEWGRRESVPGKTVQRCGVCLRKCPTILHREIIDGMKLANQRITYGNSLNKTFWQSGRTATKGGAVTSWSLKPGKTPSLAILSIFAAGSNSKIECASTLAAVTYRAVLKACEADRFDQLAKSSGGLVISAKSGVFGLWTPVSNTKDLQAADWVYIKGHANYDNPHMNDVLGVGYGNWRGENAIVEKGKKQFSGLGVHSETEKQIKLRLLKNYNQKVGTYNLLRGKRPQIPKASEADVEKVIPGITKVFRINKEAVCKACCLYK